MTGKRKRGRGSSSSVADHRTEKVQTVQTPKVAQKRKSSNTVDKTPEKKPISSFSLERHVQLCSIESLRSLEPSNTDFKEIFGREIRLHPHTNRLPEKSQKAATPSEKEMIDRVWNSTFTDIFKSRETKFRFISSNSGMLQFAIHCSTKGLKEMHIIFVNCTSFTLSVVVSYLESFDSQNAVGRISSIGFLNCTFSTTLLKKFLSRRFAKLVALSIVNCSDENGPSPDTSEDWSGIGRRKEITRLEIGINCIDSFGINLLKLVGIFLKATSVSQRVNHVCNKREHTDIKLEFGTYDLVCDLEERAHKIEELEFDMDSVESRVKVWLFRSLAEIGRLKTLVFNGWKYTDADISMMRFFLKTVRSLKSIEVKGGAYFPTDKPNILSLFEDSSVIICNIKLSGLKPLHPFHHLKIGDSLPNIFPHLQNLSVEDSDISDAEASIHEYFRYTKRPRLKTLELPGLQELNWNFLQSVSGFATGLVKLDLSGFSRWAPRAMQSLRCDGSEPMDYIFSQLSKLKILILDDLSIDDHNLFGKLNSDFVHRLIKDRDEPPHTSLALLKDLEVLSLQNTDISNITVRCVARLMSKVKLLNVSFTHVNIYALEYAMHFNPKIKIRALGCGLSETDFAVKKSRIQF